MQNKSSIAKSIEKHNFKIKKYYGQNFLTDHFITSKIAEISFANKDTTVLEIGPGTGALTEELLKVSKRVIAYEIDKEVVPILKENTKEYDNLEVIVEDILKADLSKINNLDENIICIANLPYYITSPIIDLFLKKMTNVKKAIFMMQKEVGDRISANINTKDYNSFSILVQYFARCKKILNVPRTCFTPEPNVDSVVIELEKYKRDFKPKNEEFFIKVVESSFKERRKMLVNNLSNAFKLSKDTLRNILNELEINEDARGETLSIDDYIRLSDKLEELK